MYLLGLLCLSVRFIAYKKISTELLVLLGRFSPFLYATQTLRVSKGIAVLFLGPRH